MQALWQHSALELATLIARRDVSCVEVIEAHLARIEAVNPRVNAVVRLLADEARAAAVAADRQVAAGAALGPLHGVPITVKENIDMAGLPTPLGRAGAGWRDGAGGCADGATHARGRRDPDRPHQPARPGAAGAHRQQPARRTLNPWNPGRTAGGSSGGDAVALATGMAAIGLGNDIGGSLRNPANACGIASIRPSAGRVPDAGFVPAEDRLFAVQLMNVQGPMARRVADVRAALQALMGAHPRDPWSISAPLVGAAEPGPLRVAVLPEPPGGRTDPRVAAAVRRAAAALADAGYEVTEICPPRYEDAITAWAQLLFGDFEAMTPQLLPMMGRDGAAFWEMLRAIMPPWADTAAVSELFMRRDGIARDWSRFMATYPLLLSPTWSQLPFEPGFDCASPAGAADTAEMIRPVLPANLMGLPSACVPADRDEATGLPIGVLLTGRRFREDQCLDAAEAIERRFALATPIDPVG
ncbi:Glutamyl-tRNA(Gln) amidotransferase subunit A [Methylibium sp. T29-B]|nr:amidase family protein [Methylibium sp. T29-B]EWS58154.1 Glutamyl-tRNA(Gln) amidotransferase subunit A [Methylibium sp. T29-B]